jgi:hypothetical protein
MLRMSIAIATVLLLNLAVDSKACAEQPECKIAQQVDALAVELCPIPSEPGLHARFNFNEGPIIAVSLTNESLLDSVTLIGDSNQIGPAGLSALKKFSEIASNELKLSGLARLAEFLSTMLKAETPIEPYRRPRLTRSRLQPFTLICDSIGHRRNGYFTFAQTLYRLLVRVGDPDSQCYGRCGPGCGKTSQYTQECLNHDVCFAAVGTIMGECADEFWAAAQGYLKAPNCFPEHNPQPLI